jgi:hypothetical protein
LTSHSHVGPRVKEEWACNWAPHICFHGETIDNFACSLWADVFRAPDGCWNGGILPYIRQDRLSQFLVIFVSHLTLSSLPYFPSRTTLQAKRHTLQFARYFCVLITFDLPVLRRRVILGGGEFSAERILL